MAVALYAYALIAAATFFLKRPASGLRVVGGFYFVLIPLSLLLAGSAWLSPATFKSWMQEDRWVEWSTVSAYITAAILIGRFIWRQRSIERSWHDNVRLLIQLGIASFCVFVAGEEISWGQRLIAFQPPEIFLEKNFQQELNLHNFLKGKQLAGFKLDSRYLVALIAIGFGILLPAALHHNKLNSLKLTSCAPPWFLSPWFALVAALSIHYPVSLTGEALECVLGFLFLGYAAYLTRQPDSASYFVKASAIALMVGLFMQPAVATLLYADDAQAKQEALSMMKQIESSLMHEKSLSKKFKKKSRVHKRVYTAVQKKYLRLNDWRTDRQDQWSIGRHTYFLDPWNNPYWVLYMKKANKLILYSFGSNRLRDSLLQKGNFDARGDDIIHDVSHLLEQADPKPFGSPSPAPLETQ